MAPLQSELDHKWNSNDVAFSNISTPKDSLLSFLTSKISMKSSSTNQSLKYFEITNVASHAELI